MVPKMELSVTILSICLRYGIGPDLTMQDLEKEIKNEINELKDEIKLPEENLSGETEQEDKRRKTKIKENQNHRDRISYDP